MTTTATPEVLAYHATPGPFTDLRAHAPRVRALPDRVPDLCRVVQGLIVHSFHTSLYGLDPKAVREDELQTRSASAMLDRVLALDPRPLAEARPPARRFVGSCRHFTVLLCALLRARGAPARARCGFAAYFEPGRFVDHWVAEVWDEARGSWRLVDAQLDPLQRQAHRIAFDPLDVPRTEFLVAGEAWQRCRRGRADPRRFGILDLRGSWFVLQNLVRDLAAHAKRELLPWDGWGLMLDRARYEDAAVVELLDRVAELTLAGDAHHGELLALYESGPGLGVTRTIVSFGPGGDATVDLGPGVADRGADAVPGRVSISGH
jgi:hypothetical protein